MNARHVRHTLTALGLALSVLASRPAGAQSPPKRDEAAHTAARVLGDAGVELYQKGDYSGALEKFRQAQALANVPTLGLRVARCLDKLGHLFEAKQAYEETAALTLEAGAPAAQKTAQEQARTELGALNARIPKLSIVVKGADASAIEVAVDGQPVPSAELTKRAVTLGAHHVEGRRGDEKVVVDAEAAEGQSVQVVLVFAAPAAPTPAPIAPPPAEDTAPAGSHRTLAFAALGLGVVGVGVGAITGAVALGKQSNLDGACPNSSCPAAWADYISSYNQLRAVSIVGFGVGVLGLGAGVALLLTSPSAKPSPSARRIEPWIGANMAGAKGTF